MDPQEPPPTRRPRKTPAERGVVGAYAYGTMDRLGLTLEAVANATGVSRGAVSKFMGSPKGVLAAEPRGRMVAYYRRIAAAKGITIDEPPVGFLAPESPTAATQPVGLSDIAQAIRDQTEVLSRLLDRLSDDLDQREHRVTDLELLVFALTGRAPQDGATPPVSLVRELLERIEADAGAGA